MSEIIKKEFQIGQDNYKVKFFSRPHPLGGVTWAFDCMKNGKSEGLVESRDKEVVLFDFSRIEDVLIKISNK